MKKIILLLLAIPIIGYSQIPSYYNDVNLNLSGNALQNELGNKVINTHTTFLTYTPGVWDALKQTDLDPSDSSNVILIYGFSDTDGNTTTDRTRGVNNNGGGSTDWNREHVYPRSLGNPNLGSSGPGSDAHHLRPSDVQRNSSRGNRKFADGSGNSGTTAQGHWYPGDEFKGDVARMMMYMYIHYGDRCLPKNVGIGSPATSDSNMLQLFLEWNAEDPVSQLELQRNPILEGIQGNRNPFIDNPAFATQIWGGPQAEDRFGNVGGGNDTQAPSVPGNLVSNSTTQTSTVLSWNTSTDNVGVTGYDIYRNNTFLASATTTSYSASGLTANTTYSFSVRAKDAAGNISASSSTITVTTQSASSGGNATALFFSEYIEGSSNNKALEIANYTGALVNLSGYTIKRQTNGSGSWSGGLNLSGSIANNDVFVIANSSASNTIKNVADLTSGASEMTFNGNDPVGLFKNNVLIDIIGNFNGGSSNFAKDVTLRRKADISSPSSTYKSIEWDSFPQNTTDDLGKHTFNGGGNSVDTEAPSVPTNLSGSNITENSVNLSWTAATDNINVEGYSIFQDGTLLTTTGSTTYIVSGLTTGTSYTFTVQAYDAAGNNSVSSNTITVTTQDIIVSYCESKGNTINYEFIDYVGIGGIANTTQANGGYGDFTSQVGNLNYGDNTIVLSVGFVSASYTEHWAVWIDFNKNGSFEASEQVVTGSTSNPGNLSYNFTIPTSASSGTTRMRVSMKWNGAPTSCETFGYGEVEDYTVNIGASVSKTKELAEVSIDGKLENENQIFSAQVYPNPTSSYVNLGIGDNREISFKLTDMRGRIIKSGKTTKNRIELNDVKSGMYSIELNDGTRSVSTKIVVQ
ncbi:endonuclease [Aquimarina algiphila]|uniref:T9SS type A sorting domain-containing protein n=1 Tax=Aquimarina algiphila TaxID=2047982 RepID=A0A554VKD8_9FLAO|nr:endonuclease [Aquimarina algiphila]TSE08509.1 T9SS type A sorting domain-containing protein [Aquimarina algiphila]